MNYIVKKLKKRFKKLSKIKKTLLILFLIILFFLGAVFIYSRYLLWETRKQIPDLERMLDKYLIYQSNEKYREAYSMFADEYKNLEDLDIYKRK